MVGKGLFIVGINTEVGKTVVASILVKALQADYWKPIQAGDLEQTDTMRVQEWADMLSVHFHPEAYRLVTPASPHYAAAVEERTIDFEQISTLPEASRPLVVESAGGLMSPVGDKHTVLDLSSTCLASGGGI